jgi:hypothetical protein
MHACQTADLEKRITHWLHVQAGRGGPAGRGGGQQPAKPRKRKERDAPEDEPARPWQPLNEREVQDGIRCTLHISP